MPPGTTTRRAGAWPGWTAGATLRIDARGYRTTYARDDVGRRYHDGSRVTFGFDAAGERTLMHDATGRTSTSYDDAGRVRLVWGPADQRLSYTGLDHRSGHIGHPFRKWDPLTV